MALTTTQVNQAFLGLLGRPATGAEAAKFAGQLDAATLAQTLLTDASFKNELSVETLSFKTVDLLNTDPAAFVESLYTALLGRASDAEGKAFWLSVAGATPNRADVVSQFIAAVQSQEGTADANAFATIQAEDKALASAWVESLYNNLAGRASDAEGLDFWTNAIVSFTMTPAQVAASFAAALALQGNTTEDGQNYLAKLGVADNFTANFKDFSTLITANEKAEQLKNLVTMMNGVNKDSQVDQYTQEITKITDEYQKIAAVQFTAADDDNLGIDPETGESNLKGAANFTGTYNLTDAAKGTIQSSDSATGTEAYLTDTLTINVTGYDKTTHDTFNLSELPSTSSVEKLVINNGAANVVGSVDDDFQYINVNGTGRFNISTNNTNLKDVSLNSATTKEGDAVNSFSAGNLDSLKTGAGDELVNVGTVKKSLSTGAGKDNVSAALGKGATADLGAGDDKFNGILYQDSKLSAGAGDDELSVAVQNYKQDSLGNIIYKNGKPVINSTIEIDGGTGNDTLILNGINVGIKTIKSIETLQLDGNSELMASAVSGQKISLKGSDLTLDASGATTVDLSKFSNADGENVAITVKNVKSGNVNLETGSTNVSDIKETIIISKDALKVNIKGFEKENDHFEIEGVRNSKTTIEIDGITSGKTLLADNLYAVDSSVKISNKKDIEAFLKSAGYVDGDGKLSLNLQENDEFFIISYDTRAQATNSTAKVFKYKVGKDGTIGKVDQMATINVADKQVIDINNDVNTNADYKVTAEPTVDGTGVATVTIDAAALGDASGVKVPLHTPVTSLNLGTTVIGTATAPLAIEVTGLKAKAGTEKVEVTIPNGSTISTLTFTDNTAVKLDVTASNVETITTSSGADEIIADATKTKIIDAGAGNDKIDLSSTNPATGEVTTVAGGTGIDTLVIANKAAEKLVNMSSVEKIQIKGTEIAAKAINSNNGTLATNQKVELSNAKDSSSVSLEIKLDSTSGASNDAGVDLSKLVKAAGSGDVTLSVTGVDSKDTITLSEGTDTTEAGTGFVETVTLNANARNVVVSNVHTGDKLSSTDISLISGAAASSGFQELKGSGVTVAANGAYYTSTAINKADYAGLSTNDKVLVAVNSGKNAVLHLITKQNGAEIKDEILATVDNLIDGNDAVSGGTITFKDEKVTPVTTSPINYSEVGVDQKVTLTAANATYGNPAKQKGYDNNNKVYIEGVKDVLTVSGDNATGKNADVFISGDAIASTTVITKSGTLGNVDVYLGGTSTAAGTTALDLKDIANSALVSGVDKVYAYTKDIITLKTAAALGASTKLDLSKVDAKVKFSDTVSGGTTTFDNIFSGGESTGTANDTVGITVKAATADKTTIIALSTTQKVNDVVKITDGGAGAASKNISITGMEAGDKIDLTTIQGASKTWANGADTKATAFTATSATKVTDDKVYYIDLSTGSTAATAATLSDISTAGSGSGATGLVGNGQADEALVVVKGNASTGYGLYKLTVDSSVSDGAQITGAGSSLALIGTINLDVSNMNTSAWMGNMTTILG